MPRVQGSRAWQGRKAAELVRAPQLVCVMQCNPHFAFFLHIYQSIRIFSNYFQSIPMFIHPVKDDLVFDSLQSLPSGLQPIAGVDIN